MSWGLSVLHNCFCDPYANNSGIWWMWKLNACTQRLYELGGRRVLVTGTGPLGCAPAELGQRSRNGECAAELQQASDLFNPQLVQLLSQLNSEFGSDVFISANAFAMNMDFISNPQAFGMSFNLFFNLAPLMSYSMLLYVFYFLNFEMVSLLL